MKVIAVKLTVEMEFCADTQAEVDKIVKRHANYLGIKSRENPDTWTGDTDHVLTDGANTVTVQTKEVDVGGFE